MEPSKIIVIGIIFIAFVMLAFVIGFALDHIAYARWRNECYYNHKYRKIPKRFVHYVATDDNWDMSEDEDGVYWELKPNPEI